MILRSISKHVNDQNWFAIFLDFIIVVFGVFIGIQVANWNETQNNKTGLVTILERLDREVSKNIAITDEILGYYQKSKDNMSLGREALSSCTYTPEGLKALELLLFDFTDDVQPNFVTFVVDQLAAKNSYQELLSDQLQEAFGNYIATIQEEDEQLTNHYKQMWAHSINHHPSIDAYFSNDPKTHNDYSGWGYRLDKPFEEICKDASFRNRFINTLGFYTSINQRLLKFKAKAEVFQEALKKELGKK